MRLTSVLLAYVAFLSLPAALLAQPNTSAVATRLEFFEKRIRPLFAAHCYNCHSADTNAKGGLRVDDRNGLLVGGNGGPAIVPGDPDKSLLLRRVTLKENKRRMPQEGGPLTDEQITDLTKWIRDGAAWPEVSVPAALAKPNPEYERKRKEHWAWQPLRNPTPPMVRDSAWPRDDVDRFILAKLEANNLSPVADVDKVALLRRATFDLTGLPPTPAAIDAFVKDSSNDAFAKVVDRLLASPQFGERWGRHWLDIARYGESTGPSRNIPYPFAWKYRDYVIDAINADISFNRFVREQIAGDLLPAADAAERDRLITATGFLALGVKDVNQRFKVRFVMDNVDEQIDAVTRSVLALTVSCARCHDHKFDPIPSTDYYALAGIFSSTDNCSGVRNKMGGGGLDYYDPAMLVLLATAPPPPPADKLAKLKAELAEAKKAWDAIRGTPEGLKKAADGFPTQRPYRLQYEKLQAEYTNLTDPAARGFAVHGARDAKNVGDTQVRIRGEAEKLGPLVPRGFLTAFEVSGAAGVKPRQSGRLELAEWLASEKNPLTSRVIVNRVWQHLFGCGLVSTVDNFGLKGDTPSHPELLDYLANRFMREGWSVKKLVRTLVLSHAYQLGETAALAHLEADPGNRLVWRHAPRRLDTEEIRDAILAAAGALDPRRPVGTAAKNLKMIEMRDNGPEAKTINDQADRASFRSVYLPLLRGISPHSLEAFDPVEQTLVTGSRDTSTVPGQALYMLNSPFVRRQALILAERLLAVKDGTEMDRVRSAYQLALARSPSQQEIERAQAFLTEYEADARDQMSFAPPQPKPKQPEKTKAATSPPANPDEVDQTGEPIVVEVVRPKDTRTAAMMAFAQALFGSAEFRYLK